MQTYIFFMWEKTPPSNIFVVFEIDKCLYFLYVKRLGLGLWTLHSTIYSSLCFIIQGIDLSYLTDNCLSVRQCKKYSSEMIFWSCFGLLFELKELLQSLQKYLFIPLLKSRFWVLFEWQFIHILEFFYSHL